MLAALKHPSIVYEKYCDVFGSKEASIFHIILAFTLGKNMNI
jgi:hypothetical protein